MHIFFQFLLLTCIITEDKNWDKFNKYKCKLENKSNKLFTRWQKNICKKKPGTNKILKDIDNKADEIKTCIEKIKEIKKFRNEKSIFKQIIIYKVGMDTFE